MRLIIIDQSNYQYSHSNSVPKILHILFYDNSYLHGKFQNYCKMIFLKHIKCSNNRTQKFFTVLQMYVFGQDQ